MDIYLAVEDPLSETVAEKLLGSCGYDFQVLNCFGKGGNASLKSNITKFIGLAKIAPVFLLTDLDNEDCAPALIRGWLGKEKLPIALSFRVAVKETEAWLLADAEGFSAFSGVPFDKVPRDVESLSDPKAKLIELVKRYGKRRLKADVVPELGVCAKVGLAYNQALCPFVRESWSPERAERSSVSLAKARRSIVRLVNAK
jgi:hypothetical protein